MDAKLEETLESEGGRKAVPAFAGDASERDISAGYVI
jgi:hypothetical protein